MRPPRLLRFLAGGTTEHETAGAAAARLERRVRDLENLCAEVYVAAVELGLPQDLLTRLWTVAARGESPHAFIVDMPARAPEAEVYYAEPATAPEEDPPSVRDVRLIDRPHEEGADDEPGGPRDRRRPPLPELKPLPSRMTVLIVDDDPMMLEVLIRILRRENYELLTASSGSEALARLDEGGGTVDLLVTDFVMPDMRGREVADHVRARCPGTRVLYQTGFSDMLFEDRPELDEHESFLEKPFTARGLREAARLVLFGQINP